MRGPRHGRIARTYQPAACEALSAQSSDGPRWADVWHAQHGAIVDAPGPAQVDCQICGGASHRHRLRHNCTRVTASIACKQSDNSAKHATKMVHSVNNPSPRSTIHGASPPPVGRLQRPDAVPAVFAGAPHQTPDRPRESCTTVRSRTRPHVHSVAAVYLRSAFRALPPPPSAIAVDVAP